MDLNYAVRRFIHNLWWKFIPGETFKVRWPVSAHSADPNDHYRPELEQLIGKQRIHWDWDLRDNDIANKTLTIKISFKKKHLIPYFALKWS